MGVTLMEEERNHDGLFYKNCLAILITCHLEGDNWHDSYTCRRNRISIILAWPCRMTRLQLNVAADRKVLI